MESDAADRKYTTISIPTPLYRSVQKAIAGTGFRSVTEYIVFVTRVKIGGENEDASAAAAKSASPEPAR
jgi:hypothetical protein